MNRILKSNSSPPDADGIRMLSPEHASLLMDLRHRAIRECAQNFGTPPEVELKRGVSHYRQQLLRYQFHGRAAILGLWRDAELTGMTGIRLRRQGGEPLALIYSTFVERPYRGRGLGRELVEAARREAIRRWRIRHCLMNVEVDNEPALRLYRQCGFEVTSRTARAFLIEGTAHDVFVLEWRSDGVEIF